MQGVESFDEYTTVERFVQAIANGAKPINAAIEVGWTPAQLNRRMKNDPDFVDLVRFAEEQASGIIEQVMFDKARSGSFPAMQFWLLNRDPERWRDVKRIEVHQETNIQVGVVRSVKQGLVEMLREQGVATLQSLPAAIEASATEE